ncbi:MAG: hypothetical protein Q8922_08045 [Bacteroidota bacterium]|nr:hypothetical protein [Bacteroidota bacterium]MDP4234174.1 hypothetical protein [Bacteroidota bacterium]MDP4243760.1 hypothetical protein [Bacteroidota bacterium]MDP4287875.1 hypothetical protein [Bacteroidota bacterium]
MKVLANCRFSFFIAAIILAGAAQLRAQPLAIGAPATSVDSCLEHWDAKPLPADHGDSSCLGVRFWDLDGHMVYHIDTSQRLTKVDWLTYMPVEKFRVDSIAKDLGKSLGAPPARARDEQGVYWIWDNEEIHYMLGYGKGTVRLLEFEDQSALEACSLGH